MPYTAHILDILLLDAQWRLIARMSAHTPWRMVVDRALETQSRWLTLEQARHRQDPPHPLPADIAMTRTLQRRLRPLGVDIADHIIHHGAVTFSFRANGLL